VCQQRLLAATTTTTVHLIVIEEGARKGRLISRTIVRTGRPGLVPRMVIGEVGGEVSHERVEALRPEELESVLPLSGADERRVGDDLNGGRLEGLVQLAQPVLLTVGEAAVEVVRRGGIGRYLVDIVMKGLGVLDRGGKGVVAFVQRAREVVLLQAELPEGPGESWVFHLVLVLSKELRERKMGYQEINKNQEKQRV
jgi:hypothetical protein